MTQNCFELSAASLGSSYAGTAYGSAADISAVALLTLMMRVEAATVGAAALSATMGVERERERAAESLPIADNCEIEFELSPYLQEQLQTVAASIFNRTNVDFYRGYRKATGMSLSEVGEITISRDDLRPLAYRALMHESTVSGENIVWDKPFAPRFAESLLQLQKYWDCDFLQQYKNVAGNMTAHSARRLLRKF